jgi:hypothetical protein
MTSPAKLGLRAGSWTNDHEVSPDRGRTSKAKVFDLYEY